MKCIMGIVRRAPAASWRRSTGVQHDLTSLTTEQIVDLGIALMCRKAAACFQAHVEEKLALGAFRPLRAPRSNRTSLPATRPSRGWPSGAVSSPLDVGARSADAGAGRALMRRRKSCWSNEPSVGLAPIR